MDKVTTLLTVALLVVTSPAAAQIEAGDFRIGAGILGFTYSDGDADGADIDRKRFGISPGGLVRFGYAATEMVEAGVDFNVEYVDIEVQGADTDGWEIGVGPYVGLNFPLNSDATLLLGPSLSLRYIHSEVDPIEVDAFQVLVAGELKWFVAEDASLDAGLFFAYTTGDGDGLGSDFDIEEFSVGPRIGISIWP
jgi:hypothetical protein